MIFQFSPPPPVFPGDRPASWVQLLTCLLVVLLWFELAVMSCRSGCGVKFVNCHSGHDGSQGSGRSDEHFYVRPCCDPRTLPHRAARAFMLCETQK